VLAIDSGHTPAQDQGMAMLRALDLFIGFQVAACLPQKKTFLKGFDSSANPGTFVTLHHLCRYAPGSWIHDAAYISPCFGVCVFLFLASFGPQ
jgi:hypothetical protein